jgi:hypothetical protein
MTAQTQVYYYSQRQSVVLLTAGVTAASRRYEKVYSKELTVSKGVDNVLEFAFINQNQKPVDISGKEITARIISGNGDILLFQKTLTPIYPVTGITSLILTSADLEEIDAQKAYYSLEIPVGTFGYPVFVDSQGGSRGVLNIVNGVLPEFIASDIVTIPTHPWPPGNSGNSNTVGYFSSTIETNEVSTSTFQVTYSNFTGNTAWIGSTLADFSIPYDITQPQLFTGYNANITGITTTISNTWITQTITDTANVFVGANVTTTAQPTGRIVTALGSGAGNVELNDSSNLSVGDTITFSTYGFSGTLGTTLVGYHPYVRLAIQNIGTPNGKPSANIANSAILGGDIVGIYFR